MARVGGKGGAFGGGAGAADYSYYRRPHHGAVRGADRRRSASIWKDLSILSRSNSGLASSTARRRRSCGPISPAFYPYNALAYQGTAIAGAPATILATAAAIGNHNFEIIGILAGIRRQRYRRRSGAGHPRLSDQRAIWLRLRSGQHRRRVRCSPIRDSFQAYCRAMGYAFSPALTSQEQASSISDALAADLLDCAAVWSGGLLKFIPYGDTAISAGTRRNLQHAIVDPDPDPSLVGLSAPGASSTVAPPDSIRLGRRRRLRIFGHPLHLHRRDSIPSVGRELRA